MKFAAHLIQPLLYSTLRSPARLCEYTKILLKDSATKTFSFARSG
jgi:hypothetical protein